LRSRHDTELALMRANPLHRYHGTWSQGLGPAARRASQPRSHLYQTALARETQIVDPPSGVGSTKARVNPAQGVALLRTVLAPIEKLATAGSTKSG